MEPINANTPAHMEAHRKTQRPIEYCSECGIEIRTDQEREEGKCFNHINADNTLEFDTLIHRTPIICIHVKGEFTPMRIEPYRPADFRIESVTLPNGEKANLFETERSIIKLTAIELMVNRP